MSSQRLVIYVTLLPDSTTVEYYAVADRDDGSSDLEFDGISHSSKVSLALFDEFNQWLWQRTDGGSPSMSSTRT